MVVIKRNATVFLGSRVCNWKEHAGQEKTVYAWKNNKHVLIRTKGEMQKWHQWKKIDMVGILINACVLLGPSLHLRKTRMSFWDETRGCQKEVNDANVAWKLKKKHVRMFKKTRKPKGRHLRVFEIVRMSFIWHLRKKK